MKVRNVITGLAIAAFVAEMTAIALAPEPPAPLYDVNRALKGNRLNVRTQQAHPPQLRQIEQRRPFNPDPQPWHALG